MKITDDETFKERKQQHHDITYHQQQKALFLLF